MQYWLEFQHFYGSVAEREFVHKLCGEFFKPSRIATKNKSIQSSGWKLETTNIPVKSIRIINIIAQHQQDQPTTITERNMVHDIDPEKPLEQQEEKSNKRTLNAINVVGIDPGELSSKRVKLEDSHFVDQSSDSMPALELSDPDDSQPEFDDAEETIVSLPSNNSISTPSNTNRVSIKPATSAGSASITTSPPVSVVRSPYSVSGSTGKLMR